MIEPPKQEELSEYYRSYWKFLKGNDLLEALKNQNASANSFLKTIQPDAENYRYAEGKWMLKEVIGHLCDTERILSYRALRFSRNDSTELMGFDENSYMKNSNFHSRSLNDILSEWNSIRKSTIMLFESMSPEMLDRKGVANKSLVSPRIILYFILVHESHHIGLIRERYLVSSI